MTLSATALGLAGTSCSRVSASLGQGDSGLASESGSRAGGAPSTVVIAGIVGRVMHTHGGDPAHVDTARFSVENLTTEPVSLSLEYVDFLSDHGVGDCHGPAVALRKQLVQKGLSFDDVVLYPKPALVLPASAKSEVQIAFESVDAYYSYCDTFAFRAHFRAGAEAAVAVAPLVVVRVEPRRPPGDARP